MGIDISGFQFLRYALSGRPLGDTLTLGRQEIHISAPLLRRECGAINPDPRNPFCEWLLKEVFSASSVNSMDNSAYEQATLIHDNNRPIADDLKNRFDTVLDFGTLEHIFNIPQAFENCIAMCKTGGMILHCIPANNQCGHGFWQISPELFYSLYSPENGFRETDVFLVSPNRPSEFFRVKKPANGQRATIHSNIALIVAAFTRKVRDDIGTLNVQQSDYVTAWSDQDHTHHSHRQSESRIKSLLAHYPALYERLHRLKTRYANRKFYPGFNARNPWLERVDIRSDNSGSRG